MTQQRGGGTTGIGRTAAGSARKLAKSGSLLSAAGAAGRQQRLSFSSLEQGFVYDSGRHWSYDGSCVRRCGIPYFALYRGNFIPLF